MQLFGDIKRLTPVGVDAVILYFKGDTLDKANAACQRWLAMIDSAVQSSIDSPLWLKECVPSYDSLLLVFNIEDIDTHGVYAWLRALSTRQVANERSENQNVTALPHSATKTIPVWYGAPSASDLSVVSKKTSLSIDEIIALHTGCTFTVYAVGFAPGFAYMGELPEVMACSRLSTPRKRVPKGAVAIADRQTAVYPSDSPGGWNLLGLTPLSMVNHSENESTALLKAGDTVKFTAISEEEFYAYHEG